MADRKQLLIGCGTRRHKQILTRMEEDWQDVTTLDVDPNLRPDVEWNLENLPLPFADESMEEIHAYHVLEHVGRQGDWRFFFAQFSDFWRILKPGGALCIALPDTSEQVWGDPGHTRYLVPGMMCTFLDQEQYAIQVGRSALTDYRPWYKADFRLVWGEIKEQQWFGQLLAIKPSRFQG